MIKKSRNVLKYLSVALVFGAAVFVFWYWEEVLYGLRQAKGQLHLLRSTETREVFLTKYPEMQGKLALVDEIKRFAIDSLGLHPSGSYEKVFDQKGKPIMWVITASKPYALEAYLWHFPIVGTFRYKGFFDSTLVGPEIQNLQKDGYEYRIGNASAWSTLGFLDDPLLSSFLDRSVGSLAELIIHELTHGTVFIKNDLEFNENLAEFIGAYGAKRFLEATYGVASKEVEAYFLEKMEEERYIAAIMDGAVTLDSLYASFHESSPKDSLKQNTILKIMRNATGNDTLSKAYLRQKGINNAYFTGVGTYHNKQSYFKELLKNQFSDNFAAFLAYIKKNSNNL